MGYVMFRVTRKVGEINGSTISNLQMTQRGLKSPSKATQLPYVGVGLELLILLPMEELSSYW